MKIIESLEKRRSYYSIGKELPVSEAQVTALVEKLAELVPDAFNMKSSRVVVALGEKQDMLWGIQFMTPSAARSPVKRSTAFGQARARCSIFTTKP